MAGYEKVLGDISRKIRYMRGETTFQILANDNAAIRRNKLWFTK